MTDDMPAEASGKAIRRVQERSTAIRMGVIFMSAVLGAGLLVLAIPRTVSAWAALEAEPAIEKLQFGKAPSDEELETATAALNRALTWTISARRLTDLALLELARATRTPADDARRAALLAQSEHHLIDGLALDPANSFAWLRLAMVRELQGAPGRQVAVALLQSLDMGPNIRRLWIHRAGALLTYWSYLTPDEFLSMRSQLGAIWSDKSMRVPLVQTADQLSQLPILSLALASDPAAFEELERLKAGLPKLDPK